MLKKWTYICDEVKMLISSWPSTSVPASYINANSTEIKLQQLGKNTKDHIVLTKKNNNEKTPVFSISQSSINKILNPCWDHPLFLKDNDIVRFGVFCGLSIPEIAHLFIKNRFEKYSVKHIKKTNQKCSCYFDINKLSSKDQEIINTFLDSSHIHKISNDFCNTINNNTDIPEFNINIKEAHSIFNKIISENKLGHQVKSYKKTNNSFSLNLIKIKKSAFLLIILSLISAFSFFYHENNDYQLKSLGFSPDNILTMKTPDGDTALTAAVRNKNIKLVKYLLKKGANPNIRGKKGYTPLLIAAEKGYREIASTLLKNKSEPDLPILDGWTPIMAAANSDHPEIISILQNYGASINAQTKNKFNAIMAASEKNKLDALKYLIEHGASINIKETVKGNTALHWACLNGHENAVLALLKAGSDKNIKNKKGKTPYEIAYQQSMFGIVRILEKQH